MRRTIGAAVALSLVIAACVGDAGAGDLEGTWVLTSGTGPQEAVEVPAGARVDLRFEDGQLRGTAACNAYFVDVDRDGPAVALGGVGATTMACDEPLMRAESAYLAALAQVTSLDRSGTTLRLTGDGVALVFTRAEDPSDTARG